METQSRLPLTVEVNWLFVWGRASAPKLEKITLSIKVSSLT